MEVSIGTNMMECGPTWRMARKHLAPLAEGGARLIDLHMGARYEAAGNPPALRPTRHFVEFHNERHWREIRRWLDELRLTPVCAHSSVMGAADMSSPDEGVRAFAVRELRAMIPFCAFFGIPVVVAHPSDQLKKGEPAARRWEQVARSVEQSAPDLERHGVRLALENLLPGSLSPDVEELARQVGRIGHSLVGICLDTGHLNVMGGRSAEAVRVVGAKLFALHVHDNGGRRDDHRPPLGGSTRWAGFAAALCESGYAGTLNLEVIEPGREGGASTDFVRDSLARGRQLLAL